MLDILKIPIMFDSAQEFSTLFEVNDTLIHVDFSYNNFKTEDCIKLAGGLKRNNKILGAHFTGNDFDCDA